MRCFFAAMVSATARRFWWVVLLLAALLWAVALLQLLPAFARDGGQWADSPLKPWFDKLQSGKGLCCSFADGRSVADPDWGTESVSGADGKAQSVYWVVVDGLKLDVPPEAVVTEPNRYGQAVVWPFVDGEGKTQIRCFIPGGGA